MPYPGAQRWQYIKRVAGDAFRRHGIGIAAAATALAGGVIVAVWQARVASVERAEAGQRITQVREVARSVLRDYHKQLAALPGSADAQRSLVQDALKYVDDLAPHAAGDRDLMRERADAYERIAAVQGPSARTTSGTNSAANLADTAGAEATQQKAVAIREELVSKGGTPADRLALARACTGLGALYVEAGSPQKAIDHLQNAIPALESMLGSAASEEVRLLLASAYLTIAKAYGSPRGANRGDTRTALGYMRGALKMHGALAADFPAKLEYQQRLAATHHALGLIYAAMEERDEQLEQNRKAVAVARRLVSAEPENPSYRCELAVQLGNTGSTLAQLSDKPRALEHFREALGICEAVVASSPADAAAQKTLASLFTQLGAAHAAGAAKTNAEAEWRAAKEAYASALSVYERLRADGELSASDASKPEELAGAIAKCDAALP